MADAIVNIAFQNLNAFLLQETSLLRGARSDFEEIRNELDSMRSFLRDADRRKDGDDGLKTWVGQVRHASYKLEDIIDEFASRMNRPPRGVWRHFLLQSIRLPKIIIRRHRLATRLQEVKTQIASISKREDQYQLSKIEDRSSSCNAAEIWQRGGETSLFMADDKIVGLAEKVDELVERLTRDNPNRTVVSVVGMGGLGKTTLVAQAYKNEKVKRHFDCFLWVSVSQSYNFEELLRRVIRDLFWDKKAEPPSDLDKMNDMRLLKMVNEYLDTTRYIVVLDDVWSLEAWRKLECAFPGNIHGSRILLTTRHQNIASGLGPGSYPYQLEPLQEKEAWDLFCKNAFWNEPCPKVLEPLAQNIVRKCQGLPLAIVSLGSLLSLREKTVAEWNKVYKNLSRQLSQNSELEAINHILLLSFYDLSYNLKHCFLYCCVFPEDYLIRRKQIIRLWVAEGFVEDEDGITMEEAAEDYLKELVYRNMLQVVKRNVRGRLKHFRVHDIVREVALSVSKEEKFCMIYDGQQGSRGEEFRRISIHAIGETSQLPMNMSHVRSVLVFDKSSSFSSSLSMMASNYRFMRVLHLEGVPVKSLPDELTNLFNLRYLNLRDTQVGELPKSLEKLQNLQTLDIRNTKVGRLPTGIGNLKKLRHLYCFRVIDPGNSSFHSCTGMMAPPKLCRITNLQTLEAIEAGGEIIQLIGNLTQLKSLIITKVRAADGVALCSSISKMKLLVDLDIRAINVEEALELEALSPSPPLLLQELALWGRLEKVPQWLGSLANLTELFLHWSRLREEEGRGLLQMLQMLPNLVRFALHNAYEGQQLWFQAGWFPQLKTLYVWDLTQVNDVVIEKRAIPCLQELWLLNCRELKTLPQGIEHLSDLQQLRLQEMPLEFVERMRPRDGNEERQKVAHIPLILHQWKTEDGHWNIERLS